MIWLQGAGPLETLQGGFHIAVSQQQHTAIEPCNRVFGPEFQGAIVKGQGAGGMSIVLQDIGARAQRFRELRLDPESGVDQGDGGVEPSGRLFRQARRYSACALSGG